MQNPTPRTFAQLTAVLDARSKDKRNHARVKLLQDVLPELSAPQVRSRTAPDACTGFMPASVARAIDLEMELAARADRVRHRLTGGHYSAD